MTMRYFTNLISTKLGFYVLNLIRSSCEEMHQIQQTVLSVVNDILEFENSLVANIH